MNIYVYGYVSVCMKMCAGEADEGIVSQEQNSKSQATDTSKNDCCYTKFTTLPQSALSAAKLALC